MKERPNFEKHKISFVQTFLLDASDSLVDGYGSDSVQTFDFSELSSSKFSTPLNLNMYHFNKC